MNLFWIAIISIMVVIVVVGLLYQVEDPVTEGFMAGECPNCGKRDKLHCFECSTCGWCVTPNNYGECIPGNQEWPFFPSRLCFVATQFEHT